MSSFLIYLLQVSICQAAFYLLYYFALRKHAFFQANRFYLLFSTFISLVIPLLSFEVWNSNVQGNFSALNFPILKNSSANTPHSGGQESYPGIQFSRLAVNFLFITYLAGIIFHFTKLIFGIKKVFAFINEHPIMKQQSIIWIKNGPAFFSFWKYIFINKVKLNLREEELQHVIRHEEVHIRQRHTLDILFVELATLFCWFNPFMYKMKEALSQIHEYIADETVVNGKIGIDRYSKLILQLSAGNGTLPLTHQFSKINIKNRIKMLNQSNTNKMKALKILFAMPVIAILLVFFSFSEKSKSDMPNNTLQSQDLTIGEIHWEGNTKYTDEKLNQVMDIKPGDVYKKEMIENQLNYNPEKTTVSDLYMDNGHLYFAVNLKDTVINDKVSLTFEVYEGITAHVDKIIIKGNETVETQKILNMLEVKKGDLFNRTKLIASQRKIAKSGYFDEENVNINPIPHDDLKLVDFEFTVHEIKRN